MNEAVKVNLTHQALMESQNALQNIEALELDTKTAYWVGKTMKKVRAQFNQLSKALTAKRRELIQKHGTEVMVDAGKGDGTQVSTGQYHIQPDALAARAAFDAEWEVVMEETAELEITPISLSKLGDVKITPADCANLDWLLIE